MDCFSSCFVYSQSGVVWIFNKTDKNLEMKEEVLIVGIVAVISNCGGFYSE